jgi:hypothetical protein
MDFYGFSNGVEQANALNMGSALANNAYDRMNTGLLGNANIKKVNQDQKVIDADNQDVGTAQTTSDTDLIEQGGGTAVGIGGVAMVGKGIRDAGNQLGKAKRIAEAHLKLATASGDASEISKAQSLLDVTDQGDLKGFVKLSAKYATQQAVTKALGSNIDKAVNLASDINRGTSFSPAAISSVATKSGRDASSIITSRAAEISAAQTPDEVSNVAGGAIAEASTSRTRLKAARLAARAKFLDEGKEISEPSILGTAGRPSTLRQVNVAERIENPDGTQDLRETSGPEAEFSDELFNDPSINRMASSITATPNVAVDVEGEGAAARTIKTVGTSDTISNLGLGTGGDMAIGTETVGQRGIAATFRKGIKTAFGLNKGVLNLSEVGGLEDVNSDGETMARLGGGWAENIANKPSVVAPVVKTPVLSEAPVVAEAAEQTDTIATKAVIGGAVSSSGPSTAANLLGSSEHAEAIAGGGVDEVGIKAVTALGGISGAIGGAALKTVSAVGQTAKVLGPIANVAFTADQTYEEAKSIFGKSHSLEGVGGWEKGGNVLKEAGDITATIGSALALAGPATLGLSDVAALGVELGGGAMALAGDLMDDYGKKKQDQKAQAAANLKLTTDKKQQAADATASNTAAQIAGGSVNKNLSGRGSIAQVSQSAVRSY